MLARAGRLESEGYGFESQCRNFHEISLKLFIHHFAEKSKYFNVKDAYVLRVVLGARRSMNSFENVMLCSLRNAVQQCSLQKVLLLL